jgi:hypothetical protein
MKPLQIILLVIGVGFMAVLGAFIIIPNVREESAPTPNEALVIKDMSIFMPAEKQCRAACYFDPSGTYHGEFGFLNELSGNAGVEHLGQLIPPMYHGAAPVVNDYRFTLFLPNGPTSAVTDPYPGPRDFNADATDLRNRYFVVYAVPINAKAGRDVYAMDQTGQILCRPTKEVPAPLAWYALYGDKSWGKNPAEGWNPPQQ